MATGYFGNDWADYFENVASVSTVNGTNNTVYITPPQAYYGYAPQMRFYFLNVLETGLSWRVLH